MRHRFGSHVCQTLLTLAGDTTAREAAGQVASDDPDLRTITVWVTDLCEVC